MRCSVALMVLALTLGPAPAQRPGTWRCGHVLAEDGATWRDDVIVTTILDSIVSIEPHDGRTVDRDLGDVWVIPGLIDLHTHLLLRPYRERSWNEQVLEDSHELRALRGVRYAQDTLHAGFVAIRDLGTEGAGYADVAIAAALDERVARGPRIYPATRAIVRTGWYGPAPNDPGVPKGAQCVASDDEILAAVREQVAGGASWIKVYADYRKGTDSHATPSFSLPQLEVLVQEASRLGRPVAAHATTDEGIRRAVLAGARTIEHGQGATAETFVLMRERSVVLLPCLAANAEIVELRGHQGPVVERLNLARVAVQRALASGVTIGCGSDAGVFRHGDNARELELLVAYGMEPVDALAAATRVAARVLGAEDLGVIRPGARCGLVALAGNPFEDIRNLRRVRAVIREGDELEFGR
ncbi:MAG: amidohydrolase family protein [Planctomycetota bacterium]